MVTVAQNFDSLGTPPDHVSRSPSDTYYLSASQLLRTHTSAHQADAFREGTSPGYTIAADVYRRDEIDRSHYPIFHQMEGARSWSRADGDVAAQVLSDLEKLPTHDVLVEDPNPPFHAERNPLQEQHVPAEAEAIAAHLKRSLELMIVEIFSRAAVAAGETRPLQMRWVEAYFPFTSPSWELEVLFGGEWLEVLGCGVVQHALHSNAGRPDQLGWAFGVGLDRIAMLLFDIPDIRLFWSTDPRFLSQFSGVSDDLTRLRHFAPFSKYPGIEKDVSFWLPVESENDTTASLHDNDVADLVRTVAGDTVEYVRLFDEFTHPKTGRRSLAYSIHYRSLERTLTHPQANEMHEQVRSLLVDRFGVELR